MNREEIDTLIVSDVHFGSERFFPGQWQTEA
jgi:hypothetical protein